ncbi:MAG: tetratricopeptide repeat protein, partial [Chloroflexota bacterium]
AQGDRKTAAIVMNALAQLRAMNGEFEEARNLYRQAQATLAEVGSGIEASSTSIETSRVELLANDVDAAERELRRDDAALAAIDEAYFRSTVAAILANVLWRRGSLDEADSYAQLARQLADEDDVWSQAAWRTAQAKVLAERDRLDEAIALAQAAVDLVTSTEDVELRAQTLADLGSVLVRARREEEAGPLFREALQLYEQKGDRPSAALVRRQLAELGQA